MRERERERISREAGTTMTIEMCSKTCVRNREGVETDVVDTKCVHNRAV